MYLCHTRRKYTMCATVCGCGSSLCWALTVYPKGLFCFLVSFPPSAPSWKECRRTGHQGYGIPFCSVEALIHTGAEVTQGELNVPPWFLLTELITDKELDSPGLLLAQRCATFGVMCWSYMHLILKGPCNKWKPQKRAGFSENFIQEVEISSVLITSELKSFILYF